ncbi:Filamin-B [Varanus komodoensis]|nr:Filamin-B [Varanus komodoensis]
MPGYMVQIENSFKNYFRTFAIPKLHSNSIVSSNSRHTNNFLFAHRNHSANILSALLPEYSVCSGSIQPICVGFYFHKHSTDKIFCFRNQKPIQNEGSPFKVPVKDVVDPCKVKVVGPGLGTAVRAKIPQAFTVDTSKAGVAPLEVTVMGPRAKQAQLLWLLLTGELLQPLHHFCCHSLYFFHLNDAIISPTHHWNVVPKNFAEMNFGPWPKRERTEGRRDGADEPDSQSRRSPLKAISEFFKGDPQGESNMTGLAEPVSIVDNGDGTHTVSYTPTQEGPYTIGVKYADEEIPRSPFKVKVLPTYDANKVTASGPGLSTHGIPASMPAKFVVDAKDAGQGLLSVHDQEGKPKRTDIHDNNDGTYAVTYLPDKTGRYSVGIKYGGDDIPLSPYRVRVSPAGDASKCLATGPGIAATVKTGEEVGFVVDAKSAGKGKVTCTVLTPDGTEAEAEVIENEDGTYDIYYTAAKPGTYVIYVRFGGVDIPNSPFTVMSIANKQEVNTTLCSQLGSAEFMGHWGPSLHTVKGCLSHSEPSWLRKSVEKTL